MTKRTSWLYCPHCRHDLNGDNDSFIGEAAQHWFYLCAQCGVGSKFSLHFPVPVYVP